MKKGTLHPSADSRCGCRYRSCRFRWGNDVHQPVTGILSGMERQLYVKKSIFYFHAD